MHFKSTVPYTLFETVPFDMQHRKTSCFPNNAIVVGWSPYNTMESLDAQRSGDNRNIDAVAIASMQYGIDAAAVGGLQAMPGFLMVFGYEDPASPLGYGIGVSTMNLC